MIVLMVMMSIILIVDPRRIGEIVDLSTSTVLTLIHSRWDALDLSGDATALLVGFVKCYTLDWKLNIIIVEPCFPDCQGGIDEENCEPRSTPLQPLFGRKFWVYKICLFLIFEETTFVQELLK